MKHLLYKLTVLFQKKTGTVGILWFIYFCHFSQHLEVKENERRGRGREGGREEGREGAAIYNANIFLSLSEGGSR